jgi:outer membrane protein assembly factor BamE (lipoprotein component of BamABCDE complex)
VGAGMLLAACEKEVRIRGHVPDPDSMEAIKAGLHSRDDVLELLGTPSTISTFDDQKWYYIGQKSIQFAYKRPRVLDRNVVVVSFDESGYVTETTFYSLEDAQEIKPVARVTPDRGVAGPIPTVLVSGPIHGNRWIRPGASRRSLLSQT